MIPGQESRPAGRSITIAEIQTMAREQKLAGENDEMLRRLLAFCAGRHKDWPNEIETNFAIQALRDEIQRRELCKQAEATRREAKQMHEAAVAAQAEIRDSITRMHRNPHWTLTPAFWIGLATLVVSLGIFVIATLAWFYPREPILRFPAPPPAATTRTNDAGSPATSSNAKLSPPASRPGLRILQSTNSVGLPMNATADPAP